MKKVLLAAVVLMASLGIGFAADTSDSFNIVVGISGDRGVIISTTSVAMGSLTLGTTTQWNYCVPVLSTGSLVGIEYTMQGANAATWTLSSDGHADAQNEMALHALFNTTKPSLANFDSASTARHLITTGSKAIGNGGADTNLYFEGDEDMDNMGLNIVRHLWLQVKTPPTSSVTANQTFTVTISAEATN